MNNRSFKFISCFTIAAGLVFGLPSALTANSPPASTPGLPGSAPPPPRPSTPPAESKKTNEKPYQSKKLKKEYLPVMEKPFGMPGVVGWSNNRWEANDYLGMVSNHISLSVEILVGDNVPKLSEDQFLNDAKEIFTKEGLTPRAIVQEGPQLPFFHMLVFLYPVDFDKFVIVAVGRLFEKVEVQRKDFVPKGYWQAITWETQDISMVNKSELESGTRAGIEKVLKAFVKRYREYNPENPDLKRPPELNNTKAAVEKK